MIMSISASLMARQGLQDEPDWVNRIIDIWRTTAPASMPEFVCPLPSGARKRIGEQVDGSLLRMLASGWEATRRRPAVRADFVPGVAGASLLFWTGDPVESAMLVETVELVSILAVRMKAHHAFIQTDERPAKRLDHIQWWGLGMANLYWWTFFGPAYVELIGADVIERVPAYRVVQLGDGYAVQLTERAPSSAHEPAFLAARAAAIAAIGQDYFTGLSDMPPRLPDLEKFGLLTEHGAPYTYHDPNFDQIPILEAAVGEAVDRLARTHDMTPFAVALKLKGEIEVLAAATSGVDTTAQAHDSLVDQLRNMAQAGMIRGCGIVSETTRRWAVGQARTNTPYQRAIEIQVEHRSAVTAATFSLPYLRLGTEIRLAMPPRREWGFRTYWRDSKNLVFHI